MKINFICLKFPKAIFSTICIILIILTLIGIKLNLQEKKIQESSTSEEKYSKVENNIADPNIFSTTENQIEIQIEKKDRIMPEKLKGFKIIGKIEIPKLKLEKYILSESNSKSLKSLYFIIPYFLCFIAS